MLEMVQQEEVRQVRSRSGFFVAGSVYRHHRPDGRPSELGVLVVLLVASPPHGFALPGAGHRGGSGAGFAFGWRRAPDVPGGPDQPQGAYTTDDFTGWHEIDDTGLLGLPGHVPDLPPDAKRRTPRPPAGEHRRP
ncbi:hypothetical protein [Kitasatospora sp. NPDC094015]|uniref:hypothetical protein n=1 Tax=Kitasatospora sp. NPDC094015 TaxID=3155205 RepID=UPI00332CA058